jgi:hypothetical protein
MTGVLSVDRVKRHLEAAVPGSRAQVSFHGMYRVTIEVFHEESGHGDRNPLMSCPARALHWGHGPIQQIGGERATDGLSAVVQKIKESLL